MMNELPEIFEDLKPIIAELPEKFQHSSLKIKNDYVEKVEAGEMTAKEAADLVVKDTLEYMNDMKKMSSNG